MSAVLAEAKASRSMAATLALSRAEAGNGVIIHRALNDVAEAVQEPVSGHCTAAERGAVADAFKPLADCEAKLRALDLQGREIRYGSEPGKQAKLDALAAQSEALKAEHARLRGQARCAYLNVLDVAAMRAGAAYRAACNMVADSAAELEGLAVLRDELVGQNTFDPMGIWARSNALLAPPLGLRPRGWCAIQDVWGRENYWAACTAGHLESVRKVKADFRADLEPALSGAAFPFSA